MEKAKRARATNAIHARATLRHDFLDAGRWEELARAQNVRLPSWLLSCTPGRMAIWLKRLGLSLTAYRQWSGLRTLAEFREQNPAWPLRAFVGLLLEEKERI